MAHPTSLLWTRDPHTEAKHAILRRYLQAWWPILLQQSWVNRLTFLDGFAGPGEYDGETGERPEGSPCVALRSLLDVEHLIGRRPICFVFIEKMQRRKHHLEQLLQEKFPTLPDGVSIRVEAGTFEESAERLLTEEGAWGAPVFANLDTWGVGDIPCDVVRRIAKNPSSEVLITFLPEFFVRFGDPDLQAVMNRGHQQFCSESWQRGLSLSGEARERVLLDEYQKTLLTAGMKFALPFALSNFRNSTLYLVYGTTNRVGVVKMKDAMWKIDPVDGTSFRDPRDPNQLALGFKDPNLGALRDGIVDALRQEAPQTVDQIRVRFFPTMYKDAHVSKALRQLRDAGILERPPGGKKLTADIPVWLR